MIHGSEIQKSSRIEFSHSLYFISASPVYRTYPLDHFSSSPVDILFFPFRFEYQHPPKHSTCYEITSGKSLEVKWMRPLPPFTNSIPPWHFEQFYFYYPTPQTPLGDDNKYEMICVDIRSGEFEKFALPAPVTRIISASLCVLLPENRLFDYRLQKRLGTANTYGLKKRANLCGVDPSLTNGLWLENRPRDSRMNHYRLLRFDGTELLSIFANDGRDESGPHLTYHPQFKIMTWRLFQNADPNTGKLSLRLIHLPTGTIHSLDTTGSKFPHQCSFFSLYYRVLADTYVILVHSTCVLVFSIGNGRLVGRFDFQGERHDSPSMIDTSRTDVLVIKSTSSILVLDFREKVQSESNM